MQFEIVHLKSELEKQFKKQMVNQFTSKFKIGEPEKNEEVGGSSFKMTLNRIASLA
jgi:hypothetical protein